MMEAPKNFGALERKPFKDPTHGIGLLDRERRGKPEAL